MKQLFVLAAIAAAAIAPAHVVVVTQWNFNSVTPDSATNTGTTAPAIGAGTASLVGGTTGSFASGDASGGSSDPASGDDSGWQTTTYAAQGTGDKTRGVQFLVSTVGYTNVVVTWDQRNSNTASRYTQLQYTTDGSSFMDAMVFEAVQGGDKWYNARSMDLSSVAGVANNANFGFRIVATFAPSTTSYLASTAGNSYATTGTNRFDMVTVMAAPVPEPETYALMLAGLAAVGLMARRRQA
jgi:hypothetical protein